MSAIDESPGSLQDLKRRFRLLHWRIMAKLSFWNGGIASATVLGKKMFLDLSDRTICENLYVRRVWEPQVTRHLRTFLSQGMTVLDIGANVGYYTLLFSELVGSNGRVFAFEPEPSRFNLLKANVEENRCTNVVLRREAVSNMTGEMRLNMDPRANPGDNRLFDWPDARSSVMVKTVRLDDLFPDPLSSVDFVKMDIQGAEAIAFQGMRNLVSTSRAITVLMEFWPEGISKSGMEPKAYLDDLVKSGFHLYVIDDEGQASNPVSPQEVLEKCRHEVYLLCRK